MPSLGMGARLKDSLAWEEDGVGVYPEPVDPACEAHSATSSRSWGRAAVLPLERGRQGVDKRAR